MQIRLPLLAFSNTGIYHYSNDIESQFFFLKVNFKLKELVI